ncbi:TonB-dependent siderophore receptor [Sphaerotilus mobilis]|uniref:Outer membrane receptor for ferric coprogen and ferric-rhodotorulic acid n=1 Tax=Sphaerotilus mobilis TaxID=47994 RepID=A0A4Q7LT55_9BURK|nr:TonB-dependent receptor plug domain-containing protein [Sphaerotilus mobilis]RZS57218.1 outer membrane receptor for ferric coprogen and ferric-rhodotorulic acid [Sphaerotilus mobilis]
MSGRFCRAAALAALAVSALPGQCDDTPSALPRVEIHPAPQDAPPAPGRSVTTPDLSSPDWAGANDWQGLAAEVPGLFVRVGDGGLSSSYTLRGFGLTRTLLDGLPDVLRLYVRDPATVRRIEVQHGASGVDQGIGSPGGMLALSTPLPSATAARRITLQAGSTDWRRSVVDLDQPLGKDWRSRMVIASQDGRSDPGGLTQQRDHVLGTLSWVPRRTPADGGLRLVAERQIDRRPYAFGTVLTPTGSIRYDQLYASPHQRSWRGVSQLALHGWQAWQPDVDQRMSLRADVARAEGRRDETLIGSWDQRSDGDLNGYYTHLADEHRQSSARLEARWQIDTDTRRHDTRIGLDRLHRQWLFTGVQNLRGFVIDADAPDHAAIDPGQLALTPRYKHQRFDESGRSLRHRIDWPGAWAVSTGLRQVDFREGQAKAGAAMATVHEMQHRVHDVSLERPWSDDWLGTLAWADGVEPNTGQTRLGDWLPPQRSATVEMGLRHRPIAAASPTWQLALYRTRLDGLTRADPVDRNFAIADAARQVTGLAFSARRQHGGWTVSSQFHALRPRWLQATSASVGERAVNTPSRTASLRLERRFEDGPTWQGPRVWLLWQARSSLYADSANLRRIQGTAIADLGWQGRWGRWLSTLVVRNVADRDHVASVSSVDEVYQGPVRQWRLTVEAGW